MKNRDVFTRATITGVLCLILTNPSVYSQTQDPQRDKNRSRPDAARNEPGLRGPQVGSGQDRGGKRGGQGRKRLDGQQGKKQGGGGLRREDRGAVATVLPPEVAALGPLYPLLGRPTNHSVTLNLRSAEALEAFIEFGVDAGRYSDRTVMTSIAVETPMEIVLDGLEPDTQYFCRPIWRVPGNEAFHAGPENRFHTQRRPGRPFTFEIMGDSHPERAHQFDPSLYVQTLSAAASDRPDFYMTIGDDFSVDTLRVVNPSTVDAVYWNQRQYLSLIGRSSPIFLVNGNHEPADPNYALYNQDAYRTGDVFPNSGRVRVAVAPEKVSVEYVRSYLPADGTVEHPDGEIAFRYEIPSDTAAVDSSKTD